MSLQSLLISKGMTVGQLPQLAPAIVSGMHREDYLRAIRELPEGISLEDALPLVAKYMDAAFAGSDVLLTDAETSFVLTMNYA